MYRIAQNLGGLVNLSFQSFGEENAGEFTIANIDYFTESRVWLGKILANDICFAKFPKIFPAKILHYAVCIYLTSIIRGWYGLIILL